MKPASVRITPVATDLNSLARLLHDANRLTEANPLMRRALAIFNESFGKDHPTVAAQLNNLAQLLHDTNRLAEAETLMRRALAIDEGQLKVQSIQSSPPTSTTWPACSTTPTAPPGPNPMRRALTICLTSLGPDHPNSQLVADNYTALLQALSHTEAEITNPPYPPRLTHPRHACSITQPGFPA